MALLKILTILLISAAGLNASCVSDLPQVEQATPYKTSYFHYNGYWGGAAYWAYFVMHDTSNQAVYPAISYVSREAAACEAKEWMEAND